jgi:hypothetical protein
MPRRVFDAALGRFSEMKLSIQGNMLGDISREHQTGPTCPYRASDIVSITIVDFPTCMHAGHRTVRGSVFNCEK